MNIPVKLNLTSQLEEDSVRGILATLFSELGEIMLGKQRSSFPIQFYRERLSNVEKREILWVLKQISAQFAKTKVTGFLNEHSRPPSDKVGEAYMVCLNFFRQKEAENGM